MKINGNQKPQFNCEEVRFSATNGGQYSNRIVGLADKVREMVPQLLLAGAEGVFRQDSGPLATLDYSFGSIDLVSENPANENPARIWEFFATRIEKDYLQADIAAVNALTTAETLLLRSAINGVSLTASQQDSLSANGLAIYSDILSGQTSVIFHLPTLRLNKLVSNSYTVKAALTDVRRIITTSTLSVQESIPNTILFSLPDEVSPSANRAYGWLKDFPNVNIAGSNKFSVSQEWEYNLWSTTAYGIPL